MSSPPPLPQDGAPGSFGRPGPPASFDHPAPPDGYPPPAVATPQPVGPPPGRYAPPSAGGYSAPPPGGYPAPPDGYPAPPGASAAPAPGRYPTTPSNPYPPPATTGPVPPGGVPADYPVAGGALLNKAEHLPGAGARLLASERGQQVTNGISDYFGQAADPRQLRRRVTLIALAITLPVFLIILVVTLLFALL